MNFLIIDGAQNKINFFCHHDSSCYNKSFESSKSNNDRFSILLFDFLTENYIKLKDLKCLFINQGPGKFSAMRTSISVAKALSVSIGLDLYGFNTYNIKNNDYMTIFTLFKKGLLKKNLIKPVYSS